MSEKIKPIEDFAAYHAKVDAAHSAAKTPPGWNKRFLDALDEQGLKLVLYDGSQLPPKAPFVAPYAVEGEEPTWHKGSLIVPK